MSDADLPVEGAVLVISPAGHAARWASLVADRNSSGQRTALLVVEPGEGDVEEQAAAMAAEVFRGASWELVDARRSHP